VVPARLREQPLPQVTVDDGLLAGVQPAGALPALPPAVAKAVHDVGAVAVEVDSAPAVDGRETFDGGGELHALVGGPWLGAGDAALVLAVGDDRRPAAGAGIAGARAVRIDDHVRRGRGVGQTYSCQYR